MTRRRAAAGLALLLVATALGAWAMQPRFVVDDLQGPGALEANRWIEEQGPTALPMLLAGLDHPQAGVRSRCVIGLDRLADQGTIPHLIALLNDADVNVRAVSARALTRLRAWGSPAPLLACLRKPGQHPRVRGYMMEALSLAQVRAVVPDLVATAADRSASQPERLIAIAGIQRMRAREAEAVLTAILAGEDDPPRVRYKAGQALGRLQTPSAYATLIAMLSRPGPDLPRAGAATGLLQAPSAVNAAARPVLERLSRDLKTEPRTRIQATRVLLEMKVEVPAAFLAELLLKHPEKDVRKLAALAIPYAREEEVWDSLFDAQDRERSGEVRQAIASSISKLP